MNEIEIHFRIQKFLIYEAELLDAANYSEWFQLFNKDIIYQIPTRTTRYKKDGSGISEKTFHVNDDYHILDKRVRRFQTKAAWSEDPPSRTRHLITNIRIKKGNNDDEYSVKSNFLLYRSRGDEGTFDLLSGERADQIIEINGNLKISRRLVLIDQSTLSMNNLAVFL